MNDKISVSQTQAGQPVVSFSGRQLCSFVNPEDEARMWVQHYSDMIEGKNLIVVLGLGSGYHVQALREETAASLLVIEKSPELIALFKKNFNPILNEDLHFLELSDDLSKLKSIVGGFKSSYATLTFAPAVYAFHGEYKTIYAYLNGRNLEHLNFQFSLRGVDHYFCPTNLSESSPVEAFRNLAKDQNLSVKWRHLFRMMGEIIR